jgi:hypothetical protein
VPGKGESIVKSALWKLLLILTLCVIGFAFYRGWFTLSSHRREAQDNKVDVTLTVDPDKVKEDATKVKEKTTEFTGKATDEAKELEKQ